MRSIVDTEYADAPVDEPGNDDLGAISSWYVWAALGLFPVTPGSANLALASPLFPSVHIMLPDGHRLVEDAPGARGLTALRPRPDGHRRDAPGLPIRLCDCVCTALPCRRMEHALAAGIGAPDGGHSRLHAHELP